MAGPPKTCSGPGSEEGGHRWSVRVWVARHVAIVPVTCGSCSIRASWEASESPSDWKYVSHTTNMTVVLRFPRQYRERMPDGR